MCATRLLDGEESAHGVLGVHAEAGPCSHGMRPLRSGCPSAHPGTGPKCTTVQVLSLTMHGAARFQNVPSASSAHSESHWGESTLPCILA